MKQLFTLIIIAFTAANASAQSFTLTSAYNPRIGDKYTSYWIKYGNGTKPDPKAGGANIVWDYSAFTTGIDSSYGNFVETVPADKRSLYPMANTLVRSSYGDYTYYDANTLGLNNWGYLSTTLGETKYDDGQLIAKYPLAYGETYQDSLKGSSSVKFQGFPVKSYRKANQVATFDGYGSLILPGGITYPKVVRIKAIATGIDDLGPVYGNTKFQTAITYYTWYAEGINYPVFNIVIATATGVGTQQYSIASGPYVDPTAVESKMLFEATSVSPNPANETLNVLVDLQNTSQVSTTVKDLIGNVVVQKQTNPAPSQTINLSTLNSGMYLLEIETNNLKATKKFVKN